MRYFGRIVLSVAALVTITFSAAPQAAFYSWEDEEGNTHFTDDLTRVPASYREQVHVESLPESTNVTPAPPPPPPAGAPTPEPPDPTNDYSACLKRVKEERERLTRRLEEDQDRLVELNQAIRRSVTSRHKNAHQRERVAVKERISTTEQMLREKVPPMEEECEAIRYWQGEE